MWKSIFLTPGAQITERVPMKYDGAQKALPRYVGYAEIEKNFLIDRRTIQRLRRVGEFPSSVSATSGKNGRAIFLLDEVLAWDEQRRAGLVRSSATEPGDLSEDELHDQALMLAAQAHSKRTGREVDPAKLSLHLTETFAWEVLAEQELEEHRFRAAYLSGLPDDEAMLIVATLLPQLRSRLMTVASPGMREAFAGPDPIEIDFKLICGFLRLFELQTRLSEIGMREPTHQTVLEQLSEFEPGRAFIVAAWLFPALRPAFAAGAETSFYRELFADQEQLRELAVRALNDDEWAEIESDLLMRQRALETPPQATPPAAKRSRRREREHLADTGQIK